ncbi:peptidoglycan bridge formation glycyltransferase FemA/FemB family protein [Candidatus Gottesmanbacteria bacterium]|nr:peptidoglycan bridge formation glycyltransferase FemA/FemB family protein [Candidatus Gottesmanbacteria bacterium]
MIRYNEDMSFAIGPIHDAAIWENFITTYSPQSLFQSWLWGVVQEKSGHKLWRFGLFDNQKLAAIFQITKVIARRGSYLHIRHGPIVNKQQPHIWKIVIGKLKRLAHIEHAWFIRISPLIDDSLVHRKLLQSMGFRPSATHEVDGERCWLLNLDPPLETLLKNMRKTTRYEIRRAQTLGVIVEKSKNISDLSVFHKLYEITSMRHGFVPHKGIDIEFEEFTSKDRALLLLGRYEGNVVAAAIILFYGNQAIYHHSASIPSNIPANYLIQWEAIREAKRRGLPIYNFWGIAPENSPHHPWLGLTHFKKGFGGRQLQYIHAHDLPLSPLYHITRSIEAVHRVRGGY